MSKRVLITGATGFVGRHMVPSLVSRGVKVFVVTRGQSAIIIPGATILPAGDLRDDIDWSSHVDGMDAVIHLAALAHITSTIPEVEYDRINRQATVRVAKATAASGAKLIFASSIAAQSGPSSDLLLSEQDEPRPTSPYGRSKLNAEREISSITNRFVILRPTLIYGSGVIGNMRRLIGLALSRVPPPFGLIRNRRSILSITNMCDAVCFALDCEAALGNTFILADKVPISTAEMVTLLRHGAGLNLMQIPIPPVVLSALLATLGRGDIYGRVAGNLVASVAKLESFGFQWNVNTREALYNLGALYRHGESSQTANRNSIKEPWSAA